MCCGAGRDRQCGGTLMPLPQKLYAVVNHSSQPVTRKPSLLEVRANKLQELKTKEAIDRANVVLDRLEQRVAHYDAEIQLLCEEYLKPLERRRAGVQQRIDWGIRSWQNCPKR